MISRSGTCEPPSLYAFAALTLADSNGQKSVVRQLLDSASKETMRVENANSNQPNKNRLAQALLNVAVTEANINRAKDLLKNQPVKLQALQALTRTMSYRQRVYEGRQLMPENISDADHLDFLRNSLVGFANSLPVSPEWKVYNKNVIYSNATYFIPYVDETN